MSDKLPNAEEVLKEKGIGLNLLRNLDKVLTADGLPGTQKERIIWAMHEYCREVIDVIAEDVKEIVVKDDSAGLRSNQQILKFKELLK